MEQCFADSGIAGPAQDWAKVPENVAASGAIPIFAEFNDRYNDDDPWKCRENGFGPMPCYASVFTGEHNFGCGLNTLAMCRIPSAQEVLTYTDVAFGVLTNAEKVEHARQVYFNMKNFEAISLNAKTLYDIFGEFKAEFGTKADELVKIFTAQPDNAALDKCETTKEIIRTAVSLSISIATTVTFGYGKFTGVDGFFDTLIDMKYMTDLTVELVKNAPGHMQDLADDIEKIIGWSGVLSGGSSEASTTFWRGAAGTLSLTAGTGKGMCATEYGVGKFYPLCSYSCHPKVCAAPLKS